MHKFYLLLLGIVPVGMVFGQNLRQSSAISNRIHISLSSETVVPPYLTITNYQFSDADGNLKIDADEMAEIAFDLENSGKGPAEKLSVAIAEKNNVQGLSFGREFSIDDVLPGEKLRIEIPVTGLIQLSSGKALFEIVVKEPNDFGTEPFEVEIETQAFREPLVRISDYQVSSQNSTVLRKRIPFDLDILVQNVGMGTASEVVLDVAIPSGIFCLSSNPREDIGELKPGEQKLINYQFITTTSFAEDSIPFQFSFTEKHKRYFENRLITLLMEQEVSSNRFVVQGRNDLPATIQAATLTSDVDRNIPEVSQKNPYKMALIIGNENYTGMFNSEVNVEYARRDAEIFRNYAIYTLGVEEKNAILLTDATAGTMRSEIERIVELTKRMGSETELIFFYAGHGFPDEVTQTPYLIPVDVRATNLSSAIRLSDVYQKFSESNAGRVTVFLDACFSGGGRNQGLLAARAVRIKPKDEDVRGNMVVFAASQGEQSALPYHDQKHGMFTYFLLKKLQESKGDISYGELDDYLRKNVSIESLRINSKSQDPAVNVSPAMLENWRTLKF